MSHRLPPRSMLSRRALLRALAATTASASVPAWAQPKGPPALPPPAPPEVCERVFATDMLAKADGVDKKSTMKPFERGDIFVGCTLVNDAEDDHAGPGRILQYDAKLAPKGVLWVRGTTHLLSGLAFAPNRELWAFDPQSHTVVRVLPSGKQAPALSLGDRPYGRVQFRRDGTTYVSEHLLGTQGAPGTCMKHVAELGGRYGEPKLHKLSKKLAPLDTYDVDIAQDPMGFRAITSFALHPAHERIAYLTEMTTRVLAYDLAAKKQLPDLLTLPPERGMVFALEYVPDGRLLVIRANRTSASLLVLDEQGKERADVALPSPGWATVSVMRDRRHVLMANIFSGQVAKVDFETGHVAGTIQTDAAGKHSLAGATEFAG